MEGRLGIFAGTATLAFGGFVNLVGQSVQVSLGTLIPTAVTIGTIIWRLAVDRQRILSKVADLERHLHHQDKLIRHLIRRLDRHGIRHERADETLDETKFGAALDGEEDKGE